MFSKQKENLGGELCVYAVFVSIDSGLVRLTYVLLLELFVKPLEAFMSGDSTDSSVAPPVGLSIGPWP